VDRSRQNGQGAATIAPGLLMALVLALCSLIAASPAPAGAAGPAYGETAGIITEQQGDTIQIQPESGGTVTTVHLLPTTRIEFDQDGPASAQDLVVGAHLYIIQGRLTGGRTMDATAIVISLQTGTSTVAARDGATLGLAPEGENATTTAYLPPEAVLRYEDGAPAAAAAVQPGTRIAYKGRLGDEQSIYLREVTVLGIATGGIVAARDGDIATIWPDDGRTLKRVTVGPDTVVRLGSERTGDAASIAPGAHVFFDGVPGENGIVVARRLTAGRVDALGVVTAFDGHTVQIVPEAGRTVSSIALTASTTYRSDIQMVLPAGIQPGAVLFASGFLTATATLAASEVAVVRPSGRLTATARNGATLSVRSDAPDGPSSVVLSPGTHIVDEKGGLLADGALGAGVVIVARGLRSGATVQAAEIELSQLDASGTVTARDGDSVTLLADNGHATTSLLLTPATVVHWDNGGEVGADAIAPGFHLTAHGMLTPTGQMRPSTVTLNTTESAGTVVARSGQWLTLRPSGDRTVTRVRLDGSTNVTFDTGGPASHDLVVAGAVLYTRGQPLGDGAMRAGMLTVYQQDLTGTVTGRLGGGRFAFLADGARSVRALRLADEVAADVNDGPAVAYEELGAGSRCYVHGYPSGDGEITVTTLTVSYVEVRGTVVEQNFGAYTIQPDADRAVTQFTLADGAAVGSTEGGSTGPAAIVAGARVYARGWLDGANSLRAYTVRIGGN